MRRSLTSLNEDKFSSQNEELNFAKYVNATTVQGRRSATADQRNPITGKNCEVRLHEWSRKASNSFNRATMLDHKSRDEIYHRKGRGLNRTQNPREQEWKPHIRQAK